MTIGPIKCPFKNDFCQCFMKINAFLHGRAVTVINEVMGSPVSLEARCYLCMSKICFLISLMIKTLNLGIDFELVRPVQAQDRTCAVGRADAGPGLASVSQQVPNVRAHVGRRMWSLALRGRPPYGPAALTAWLGFGPRGQAGSMDGCCLRQPGWHWHRAAVLGQLSREVILETSSSRCTWASSPPASTYKLGKGKSTQEKHAAFPQC